MAGIAFNREFSFREGRIEGVAPNLRRLVAGNPGPFTFHGTSTYVVGEGEVAVIDPGPRLDAHIDGLLKQLAGERVVAILVTHTHLDHSPAARPLQEATGAATYGFGPHGAGARDGVKVEEGGDFDFAPDIALKDGARLEGSGWALRAIHTPGHTSNHLCFEIEGTGDVLSGDHVMGWSTSVISPPDGDMAAYLASLEKLIGQGYGALWPAHGAAIPDPDPFVASFIAHRHAREAAIFACVERGVETIPGMVAEIYAEIDPRLHPAAARSVLAHLIHMAATGRVRVDGPVDLRARYAVG